MIEIDGSYGEGGGQVLRSALTLSLLTGCAFRLVNIRARRPKPGLRPQHLKAVEAAAAISGAHVENARPGAVDLLFEPGRLLPGRYRFAIGTAGSAPLVLQTVALPLSRCNAPSTLSITGGTHVPWSPSFHYLAWQWQPFLDRIGITLKLELLGTGFYPKGGGEIRTVILPAGPPRPLTLLERGPLTALRCLSLVSNLDISIARRQADRLAARLSHCTVSLGSETIRLPGPGKGSALVVLAEFVHTSIYCGALGSPGKPAEAVADEAADALLGLLADGSVMDPYLADQLLLPLALTPGISRLHAPCISGHLLTNAWVIGRFVPAVIDISGTPGRPGLITIRGVSL
jgi:RNA 3'-phosphate cyclase